MKRGNLLAEHWLRSRLPLFFLPCISFSYPLYKRPVEFIDRAIGMLGDTGLAGEIKAIHDFYNAVQPDFDRYNRELGVCCEEGCGECCAHFIPDITTSEALIIALQVLFGPGKSFLQERLLDVPMTNIVCPFYDPWNMQHCKIYSSRPLVCRIFYSCPTSDKTGSLAMCRCHFAEKRGTACVEVKAISTSAFRPMNEYGAMLATLPGNSSTTELLPSAVRKAIDRIGYAMNLLFPDAEVFTEENQGA